MALKALMLRKKIDDKKTKLEEARTKQKEFQEFQYILQVHILV